MPENTREVFERFTHGQDTEGNMLPYLCYAIFAAERYDWMNHYKDQNGDYPVIDEERRWVSEKPDSYFRKIEQQAVTWMDEFSHDYLAEDIELECEEAVEDSLRAEISKLGKFGPNFGNNFLAGLAATTVFAILLFLLALIVFGDISPVDLAKGSGAG